MHTTNHTNRAPTTPGTGGVPSPLLDVLLRKGRVGAVQVSAVVARCAEFLVEWRFATFNGQAAGALQSRKICSKSSALGSGSLAKNLAVTYQSQRKGSFA